MLGCWNVISLDSHMACHLYTAVWALKAPMALIRPAYRVRFDNLADWYRLFVSVHLQALHSTFPLCRGSGGSGAAAKLSRGGAALQKEDCRLSYNNRSQQERV